MRNLPVMRMRTTVVLFIAKEEQLSVIDLTIGN